MKRSRKFTVINGKARRRNHRRTVYLVLVLAALALCVRAAYFFVYDKVTAHLVQTVIAESGKLESIVDVNGLIVRNEHPVAAPVTGTLKWLAEDGQRLASGASVATLTAGDGVVQTLISPEPGILVRHLDGLEGLLRPQALAEINPTQFLGQTEKQSGFEQGETVPQGAMLFKIVNNFSWIYLSSIPAEIGSLPEAGSHLLRFDFTERDLSARLILRREEEGRTTVGYELTDDAEGFYLQRFSKARIITKTTTGVILPLSALVEREGKTGVLILQKSVVRYREVEILESDQEQVAVRGLSTGLRVIINPGLVKEGRRL